MGEKKKQASAYREPLILIAFVILGAIIGMVMGEKALFLYPIGQIWLNLLFVLLVPLLFFSISSSIANISDTKSVGKLLGFTLVIFVVTAAIAGSFMFVVLGIFGVDTSVQLGAGDATAQAAASSIGDQIVNTFTVPPELYSLDILDGSPPCSTFSLSGNREKDWGKEKVFREGQTAQVLDTLFFDFIALAKALQPKVVIAENVKGLLMGNAIDYVRRIYKDFENAGYYCQHFLLDASKMGVPQMRNRVFFVCIRHDLGANFLKVSDLFNVEPHINMDFNEPEIYYGEFADYEGKPYGKRMKEMFDNRKEGDIDMAAAYLKLTGKRGFFNQNYLYENKVCNTLTAHVDSTIPFKSPVYLSTSEVCNISTFPQDYDFCGFSPHYICGMSVPPVMMAQVATRVYEQWLSKL